MDMIALLKKSFFPAALYESAGMLLTFGSFSSIKQKKQGQKR